MRGSLGTTIVIPGQTEGLNPEPMNTNGDRRVAAQSRTFLFEPVVMGSGLTPPGRPGMTAWFSTSTPDRREHRPC